METSAAADRLTLFLADEAATARFAEDIAAALRPGDLVALSGGLGAGKTSFARALIRALAADPALDVQSPTFALRADYATPRLSIVHADLYRMRSPAELEEIGLDEAIAEAALLVEWPEHLPRDFAENRLDITLAIEGAGRRADIQAFGSWPARLTRTRDVRRFLDANARRGALRRPLVGDASVRAYERIIEAEESAILMNAPARAEGPGIYGGRSYDAVAHRALDVRPFVAIDLALAKGGVRVPEILASDIEAGLLLLEDLGNEGVLDSVGRPIIERYEAAIDLLVHMHGKDWPNAAPLPGGGLHTIPPYDRDALLIETSLFADWYRGAPQSDFAAGERADFLSAWGEVLDSLRGRPRTWVLRDFHSPNILWQEHAKGIARVGVIDFQDALIGDPAYDVASLAQDARAPFTESREAALKERYIAGRRADDPGFDIADFEKAYAIYAAQRATKVLGAFERLAVQEGKSGYRHHSSRLTLLLLRTLRHPVLSPLRVWYERRL